MGKLTVEQKMREHERGQKAVAHVLGVSRGRTLSNPMNIMKNAERRSARAME
jgi:hypothetical protein